MSNLKYMIPYYISSGFALLCLSTGRDYGFFLLSGFAFGVFTIDFTENIIGDKK